MTPDFSRHAEVRMQQRGITIAQVDAVERYADKERPRGRGCISMWLSKKALRRLGASTPEGVPTDKLQGLVLLLGSDQAVVTVLRNRASKIYRRSAGRPQ